VAGDDPLKTMLMFGKGEKTPAAPAVSDTIRERQGQFGQPQGPQPPQETDCGVEEESPEDAEVRRSEETLSAGTVVGDYVVTALLDVGGMGSVYAGEHPRIGKRVAIKVLHSAVASDAIVKSRFLQEARAVNRIQHPNIVDVFTIGELSDGRPYFVMDLLEGACLRDRLLAATPISADEAFRVFMQVCNALDAAHAAGIIHRDLKPENIYVCRGAMGEPVAKLLDFGVAKVLQPEGEQPILRTRAGYRVGTPRYMAPEQLRGKVVDHRADIYALGLVMYEVFTGDWPWEGKSEYEDTLAHLKTPPKANDELTRRCPALSKIILKCLAKEPVDRPQTARDLGAGIAEAQRLWPVSFSHVSQRGIITALQQEAIRQRGSPSAFGNLSSGVKPRKIGGRRGRLTGLWFVLFGLAVGAGVIAALTFLRR
jgi:serine/threonine protein kinase